VRPIQSIGSYVKVLREEDRLGALAIDGDDDAAVEVAFDLSYRALDADAARVFRLLGLIPGPDFDKYAAANIADLDLYAAGRLLDRLAAANLIQRSAERFHFHDLIRDYARRKSVDDGGEVDRGVRRLFDYYLQTADDASRLLHPDLPRTVLPSPPPSVLKAPVDTPAAAADWLDAEVTNMEALVCGAPPGDRMLPVWRLAEAMLGHVDRHRLDTSWLAVCTAARDRAARCGDRAAEAAMCRALGKLYYLQARYARAEELYLEAGRVYEEIGDPLGQARVLNGLASVAGSLLNYAGANQHLQVALRACRTAGDREGEAETLANLGTSLVLIGSADEGVSYLTEACAIANELSLRHVGPRAESAIALDDLYRGRLDVAAQRFVSALDTCRRIGYPTVEAQTLRNLAEVCLESGRPESAAAIAGQALALAEQIGAHWNAMGARITLGQAALALDDTETAADQFTRAGGHRAARLRFWYPFAMLGLAACERLTGNSGRAVELAGGAVGDPRPRVRAQAHIELARAYLSLGNCSSSLAHAQQACETAEHNDYRLDLARALATRAAIHRRMGALDAAATRQARADMIIVGVQWPDPGHDWMSRAAASDGKPDT
jgi:tetratricopeptide (TPR) repeat protein